MKTIWFDITNTPQVHFLLAVLKLFDKEEVNAKFTLRDFSETIMLFKKLSQDPFTVYGDYKGKSRMKKILGVLLRFSDLLHEVSDFDVSISCGSESAVWNSYIKNKPAITFGDNDLSKHWTYSFFTEFSFFPNAFPMDPLIHQGLRRDRIYLYNGYKEDIYLSHYTPDTNFMDSIPFDNYVVVRPENLMANYVPSSGITSITPRLMELLEAKGFNIIFLPRYAADRQYAEGIKNIYIPDGPLNGLDLCYHADFVLTGAGTIAREAACLGVPSVSFFSGTRLLAVDQKMIRDGWMFFSRNPEDIMNYIMSAKRRDNNLQRSKNVASEVKEKLQEVLKGF
ncbi:MAG: DUF354 domain-containing protein [Ignavibacteria bacterium]|nr:DUF354 domain-containing protein [Ignavibacteria bacterium]